MLYPQLNKFRNLINLDGIWQMKFVSDTYMPTQDATDTIPIAVPASMNDQLVDSKIREYSGKVLFEKTFSCPTFDGKKTFLRFEALSHRGEVYLNGKLVGSCRSGFLPFDCEVTLEEENRISVIVDNRLTFETLPMGNFDYENNTQVISQDFYNYTGIHRSVLLWTVSDEYIKDITVDTFVDDNKDKVRVNVDGVSDALITITDEEGNIVVKNEPANTVLTIKDARLWNVLDAYLYTIKVTSAKDEYKLNFGIRKIEIDEKSFKINGKSVYFTGFGRHEDFLISGKGTNLPVLMRDINLMNWINCNSFRTSHYPYGQEIYDYADRNGFLVIDEVQAVCFNWLGGEFVEGRINDNTFDLHKECIKLLMERDKNHPSVVMLSVANEPNSKAEGSRPYFKAIAEYARSVTKLPLALIQVEKPEDDICADLFDIIGINRYYGWYYDIGQLDVIADRMEEELRKWHDKYHKPVMVTEFGADTIEGLHAVPPVMFSEEFQKEQAKGTCEGMDRVDFCIGEHVWNFADFMTKQEIRRVNGNRKGVFTRDRQPKMVAYYLKDRWKNKQ